MYASCVGVTARAKTMWMKASGRDVINRDGQGVVGFIDVGSDGVLPEPWRSNANLIRHVLSFEPLADEGDTPNVTVVSAALWRTTETRPFYIQHGSSHGDSLYPPNLSYVSANYDTLKTRGLPGLAETWVERSTVARTETLTTTTLDAVLSEQPERYDFLKIDAQGADFDVLLGAEAFLANGCIGVHLEAFTIPLYEGITLLDGIDAHMSEAGFDRVWTAPPHGSFDSQHDVLYLRKNAEPGAALDAIRAVYGI